MISKHYPLVTWLLVLFPSISLIPLVSNPQGPQEPIATEQRQNDPLSYAVILARKTDNQFALSRIAVHHAELGDFEQAMRINESSTDEDWRTGAFAEIAVEYWKHGEKEKARQLFLRVAAEPLPKDVIYIWGDIIKNMAEAQQFDLALDVAASMDPSDGSTKGTGLEDIIDEFLKARVNNPTLPDLLPRVLSLAKQSGEWESNVIRKVAVAYAARGDFDRATKLIEGFKEDYDFGDGAHEVAIQLAKHGQYDRALRQAAKAGSYFDQIAYVQIASEALRRRDTKKALEIVTRTDARLATELKGTRYEEAAIESNRLSELAVLYSQLGQKPRSLKLADLAFKIAKVVGKPGDRSRALESAAKMYCELGLYDKAMEVAGANDSYAQINMGMLAEIFSHAHGKKDFKSALQVIKVIQTTELKEHEEFRLKALIDVARSFVRDGKPTEARELLMNLDEMASWLESDENTPEILKDFAVTLGEAGDLRGALQRVPRITAPFFTVSALIEIGNLCARNGRIFAADEVLLLDEIVGVELPPEIEPGRITNEAGWEIPGLAQAKMLRPPELQKTRDRTVQLYSTYYEPEVETFIERPFASRHKPLPGQAQWTSRGLKVSLIEELATKGHKFCYRLTVYEIFKDSTGVPKYSDHLETLLYYDEDGDGKFETLEEGLDYLARGRVPKWVLEK